MKNARDEGYTKVNTQYYNRSDVDNNTNIYVYAFIVRHSIANLYTVSARMSGHDDQFLNEVLQCQKQLTLPGTYTG